eukprot:5180241-Prymnesium_polylepis.1
MQRRRRGGCDGGLGGCDRGDGCGPAAMAAAAARTTGRRRRRRQRWRRGGVARCSARVMQPV